MKVTVIPIVIGTLETVPKGLVRVAGRVGNRRTSRDHPKYTIVEIGQNTEKNPGDLIVCLFGFHGISTFLVYLMPNPFLYKSTVLFQSVQFSISTQFSSI